MPVRGRKNLGNRCNRNLSLFNPNFLSNSIVWSFKNEKCAKNSNDPHKEAQNHRFQHFHVKVGEFLRGNFSTLIGGTCHMINLVFEKPSFKASFR